MRDVLAETYFGKSIHSTMTLMEAINLLRKHDMLNIGELAERAISVKSNVRLCAKNTPDIDLVSGKQIKHATVTKSVSSDYYKAYISIKNTTAPLLCVITNPYENRQYFLHIPPEAYRYRDGNTIAISFGRDGRSSGTSIWWNYEVSSFNKLCELAK
jgi:hypothetical protein